jgi:hypothetical protein
MQSKPTMQKPNRPVRFVALAALVILLYLAAYPPLYKMQYFESVRHHRWTTKAFSCLLVIYEPLDWWIRKDYSPGSVGWRWYEDYYDWWNHFTHVGTH